MTNPTCPGCGAPMQAQGIPTMFNAAHSFRMVCACGWAGPLAASEEAAAEEAARRCDKRHAMYLEYYDGTYECSACGVIDHREPKHNYCPNCGARMDGGCKA